MTCLFENITFNEMDNDGDYIVIDNILEEEINIDHSYDFEELCIDNSYDFEEKREEKREEICIETVEEIYLEKKEPLEDIVQEINGIVDDIINEINSIYTPEIVTNLVLDDDIINNIIEGKTYSCKVEDDDMSIYSDNSDNSENQDSGFGSCDELNRVDSLMENTKIAPDFSDFCFRVNFLQSFIDNSIYVYRNKRKNNRFRFGRFPSKPHLKNE